MKLLLFFVRVFNTRPHRRRASVVKSYSLYDDNGLYSPIKYTVPLARRSLLFKRHLDRFERFCLARSFFDPAGCRGGPIIPTHILIR